MYYLALRLLPVLLVVHGCGAQDNESPPPSPCPNVYGYGWDPVAGWQGVISIVPPTQFSEVQLVIRLSLPYYHPEAGVGRVEIKGGSNAVQLISTKALRNQPQIIQYIVIFPPFKQLPRITSVVINGREFCPGPQMYPDTRGTIELKYTLKTGMNLPIASGNAFSVAENAQMTQPSQPVQPTQVAQTSRPTHSNQPSWPQQTGMKEDVIYVVQGNHGNTYIIPGSQLTRPTQPPTPVSSPPPPTTPAPTPAPTSPTTVQAPVATAPSTTADPDQEYLSVINEFDIFPPDSGEEPTTSRPRPTPKPRPSSKRPRPRPRPTTPPSTATTSTTTSTESSDEVVNGATDEASQYAVNTAECGLAAVTANTLVLNGEETVKGQWPWQVAMFKQSNSGLTFQCGGSLISKKHIITAAHCVYLKTRKKAVEADTILIYLGKHNLRSWTEDGQQAKDVDKIILHPQYGSNNHDFDLAILILITPVEYSAYVKPVCLWDKPPALTPLIDKHGSVLGWGKDEKGEMGNTLKLAKMPVVSQETCLRSDTFYSLFTSENTFCAGFRNGTSVCNGDSGGGMYFFLDNSKRQIKTWYTRGIVSVSKIEASEGVCDDKSYVIFTDVAKLLPWITQQIQPPST